MDYIVMRSGRHWIVGQLRDNEDRVFEPISTFSSLADAQLFIDCKLGEPPKTIQLNWATPKSKVEFIVQDDTAGQVESAASPLLLGEPNDQAK